MASEDTFDAQAMQYGATVAWGTAAETNYGMIQSINQGIGGQTKEYKDHNGETKTLVVYDKHETFNLSAICLKKGSSNAVAIPSIGEVATITLPTGVEKKFRVQSASVDWANEEAARISISGRTYTGIADNNTGTPIGGSSSGGSSGGPSGGGDGDGMGDGTW